MFDNTNASWISTGEPVVDTTRSYTVSAWVKLTDTDGNQAAVSQDGAGRLSKITYGANGNTRNFTFDPL